MRSLSSTVSEIPSSCDPSRSVVSYISTNRLLWGSLALAIRAARFVASSLALAASCSGALASWSGTSAGMLAPVFVLVDLAADGLAVLLGDRLRHRTGARDRAIVHGVHRADFG